MAIRKLWPGKKARERVKFYDSLAQPFFHQGDDTGCAVLHGFTGTPANMRSLAEPLAGAGYTVYAPLLSGHGRSLREMDACSWADWLRDAYAAYDRLIEAGCRHIFLLGLSMGALLSAIVAANRPTAGLAMLSAPLKLKRYLLRAERIAPVLPYLTAEEAHPRYQQDSYVQGYRGAPLRRLADLEKLSRMARGSLQSITCPALIIQPLGDKRVDLASVEIAKHGLGGEVEAIYMENSPHACTVGPERDEIAAHCLRFIKRVLAEERDG